MRHSYTAITSFGYMKLNLAMVWCGCFLVSISCNSVDSVEEVRDNIELKHSMPDTTLFIDADKIFINLDQYFTYPESRSIDFSVVSKGNATESSLSQSGVLSISPLVIGLDTIIVVADQMGLDTLFVEVTQYDAANICKQYPEIGEFNAIEIVDGDTLSSMGTVSASARGGASGGAYWGVFIEEIPFRWQMTFAKAHASRPPTSSGINTQLLNNPEQLGPRDVVIVRNQDPFNMTMYTPNRWYISYKESNGQTMKGAFLLDLEYLAADSSGNALLPRRLIGCYHAL